MEEALTTRLLATSGLTSLVGNRIYWGIRPQGTTVPAVVLNKISATRLYPNDGPDGLVEARIQFDCWGATFTSVLNVARAIRNSFNGLSFTDGGVTFQAFFIDSERQSVEEGTPERLHRFSMDFLVWHTE